MASSTAWQRGGVIVVVDVAVMVLVDVPVVDVFVVVAVIVVAVRVYVAVIITCFGVVPSDHETGCIGPYDQGLTDGAGWFCWELMPYWPDWSYCTLGSTAEAADASGAAADAASCWLLMLWAMEALYARGLLVMPPLDGPAWSI